MRIKSFTAKSAMLTDLTFNPISETMYAYSRTNEILVRPFANSKVVLMGSVKIRSMAHVEREALTTINCSSFTRSPDLAHDTRVQFRAIEMVLRIQTGRMQCGH